MKNAFVGPASGDGSSWVIAFVCGCDPRVGGELATMLRNEN